MQPFGRPFARAALGRAGLGLQFAARQNVIPRGAFHARLSISLSTRSDGLSRRAYSTQPPSKDETTLSDNAAKERPDSVSSPSEKPADNPLNTTSTPSASELPSAKDSRRSNVQQKFSHLMDTLQTRALNASQTLNDLTGYTSIEGIKEANAQLEKSLAEAHNRLRTARHAYKTSNSKRAATQREVTTLLARKETWSPTDLERFTELYRTDHVLEGEVANAQVALTEAEVEEQQLGQRLNAGILKRYHEEQIWSDRIRRASTWGTWGLMGMNFLLFVVLQFVAEPWKRRRLVRGVVAEEKEVLEAVRGELEAVKAVMERRELAEKVEEESRLQETLITPAVVEGPISTAPELGTWQEFMQDPAKWKILANDLQSERRIDLSMRDVSRIALESIAIGGALAGSLTWMLIRRS